MNLKFECEQESKEKIINVFNPKFGVDTDHCFCLQNSQQIHQLNKHTSNKVTPQKDDTKMQTFYSKDIP